MAYEGKYICKTPYDLNNATMRERFESCEAADKDSNPPFYVRQICIENCHNGSRVHNFGRKTKKSKTKKSKTKSKKSKKTKKSKTKKSKTKSKKSNKKSARK